MSEVILDLTQASFWFTMALLTILENVLVFDNLQVLLKQLTSILSYLKHPFVLGL